MGGLATLQTLATLTAVTLNVCPIFDEIPGTCFCPYLWNGVCGYADVVGWVFRRKRPMIVQKGSKPLPPLSLPASFPHNVTPHKADKRDETEEWRVGKRSGKEVAGLSFTGHGILGWYAHSSLASCQTP